MKGPRLTTADKTPFFPPLSRDVPIWSRILIRCGSHRRLCFRVSVWEASRRSPNVTVCGGDGGDKIDAAVPGTPSPSHIGNYLIHVWERPVTLFTTIRLSDEPNLRFDQDAVGFSFVIDMGVRLGHPLVICPSNDFEGFGLDGEEAESGRFPKLVYCVGGLGRLMGCIAFKSVF